MNVNKKLGRFKQWAGERMGGEVKTSASDDFKAMEMEMTLRHEGMEKLQKSMTLYVKSLSKRNEVEDREKSLPVGYLGSTMISHGEDFEPDSEFGACLTALGRTNERIARVQEQYVSSATSSWLESLERSLAQMKEYQAARKKLETRRLAYDTSLAKMQKAKREDFRVEEELRAQKAKYEETSDDVYRRMQDIKESEVESVADLTTFLEAELAYYDRCREALMQLKKDWPAGNFSSATTRDAPRGYRPRSNTAHSYQERFNGVPEEPPEPKLSIPKLSSRGQSPARNDMLPPPQPARPAVNRGYDNYRESSPAPMPRMSRTPTEPTSILASRAGLRPVNRADTDPHGTSDESAYAENSSPIQSYRGRSVSPSSSYNSGMSRAASWSQADMAPTGAKKAPPPPPPSRAKKPPPPPPMKRSALSTSEIPHA